MIAELPLLTFDTPVPIIPTDDDLHLQAYESKLQLVRDYVRGVALGFSNGFFLFGTGGIAKSYTVLGELQRLAVDFKLFNSRMSGRGLFDALGEYPNAIHVLEDMERIVKDKDGQGIIRSACWAQKGDDGKQKRTVTWATARGVESIVFQGGLIPAILVWPTPSFNSSLATLAGKRWRSTSTSPWMENWRGSIRKRWGGWDYEQLFHPLPTLRENATPGLALVHLQYVRFSGVPKLPGRASKSARSWIQV